MDQALNYLQKNKLSLKNVSSHDGFDVYYGCDSTPFLKKVLGDTIKIWTISSDFSVGLSSLNKYISQEEFGKTIYISGILSDTVVTVATMWQTIFIHRHDSLFEIEPGEEPIHSKLIFHPKMFQNGRRKITLSKRYNYLGDQIVIERQWTRKGKKCYTIRINNKEDGEQTTYSYTFDEDIHFLFWETCYDN